ncbi:MAG: Arc family DNA-binding protein [Rhodocyclaceae bacterium]
MSTNLSVKNVPDALADKLRARAERNHRSLQGELMAIIESAVVNEPSAATAHDSSLATSPGREPVRRGEKTIEQIANELRAGSPQPISDLPRAVDILRQLRDAR